MAKKYEYQHVRMGGMSITRLDEEGANGWIVCAMKECSTKDEKAAPPDSHHEPLIGMWFYHLYLMYREVPDAG